MEKSNDMKADQWMVDLATKHDISLDLVLGFYKSLKGYKKYGYTKRSRTEEFFDLYYEELADDRKGNGEWQ